MNKNLKFLLIVSVNIFSFNALYAQTWQSNMQTAKERANELDRNLALLFTGSDWCTACVKLKREVLDSEVFMSYAADNLILIKADFPRKRKNRLSEEQQEINNKLAEQFNPNGYYPLIVVMSPKGQVLGYLGYMNLPPEKYISIFRGFRRKS